MRPRKRGALIGAAAIGATVMAGVGVAAGAAGPTGAASTPHFSQLNARQITARESGKQQSVIVVFNNQLGNLPANHAHRQARQTTAASMQAPLDSQLRQVGATKITDLSLLNAVAATMPAAEAQALRQNAGVKEVVPDGTITMGDATSTTPRVGASQVASGAALPGQASTGQQLCSASPDQPMLEPEELTSIHDASDDPTATDEASSIATGQGVVIGNVDADTLAGNPNLIRPDGSHVVIDAPDPTENVFSDEFNGDVSTMGAQGTVTYSYESQLPFSNIPPTCTFTIKGDATGASILTTGEFSDTNAAGQTVAPESQVIAGLQAAVSNGVDVVSESYGFGQLPGANDDLLAPTNQAMVKAGVTVVESSGDSGSSGTVEAPADNADIIDVGGTNDLRLSAQAYGYTNGWLDDNMTTLSSGGTAPNGRVVDLVAPGYLGLAAAGAGQDPPLPTEAFGGTSQAAPFVSGAAADVIQSYRDTHKGKSPTPTLVKQILTSTATDIGADADQQGAGLLNVYAAVEAARQMPGAGKNSTSPTSQLIAKTTQLDVEGNAGSTVPQPLKLYNASSSPVTVGGTYRELGAASDFGARVTESVTAPPAGSVIPEQGAGAATPITFNVPAGTDVLDADMRWPDPTNGTDNILAFILTDPSGKLAQESYDYGAANTPPASPDIQHSTVEHPMAGKWTAQIVWADGRGHVMLPPNVPGSYRGDVTFQASGQNFTTSPAAAPVTIPARGSAVVPLSIAMPQAPGDAPESVQFASTDGSVHTSVPIARRVLIPSGGGTFDATLTSSVSRGIGQIKTFYIDVPKRERDMDISFNAPDFAPNDPVYYYLFSPADLKPAITEAGNLQVSAVDTTPTADNPSGNASLIVHNPRAGMWEIDVMQGARTDGTRFSQDVTGTLAYNELGTFTATGLPKANTKTIPAGATVPITVPVTNTTDHVADFALEGGPDIGGGNAVTPKQLAPGATATLTATLSPTDPAGTVVTGDLSVDMSTDFFDSDPIGFPTSISDLHDFAYAYTVGASSGD